MQMDEKFWGLLPWLLVLLLLGVISYLAVKLYDIKKSAGEISAAFSERINGNTSTRIGISGQDRHMRRLAHEMNRQLERFYAERSRFTQGDLELKNAITNVSHDLRTPLTVIYGYLNLLKDEQMSEDARRYLQMIENRSDVMCQLLEEFLEYSIQASVKDFNREKLLVNRILEESLLVYYEALTAREIQPEINVTNVPVERSMDKSALNRILSNILSNVIKYSDGDLKVDMDEKGTITFSNSAASLNPVMAGKLLDRFFTLDTGTCSMGIGLSEVKLLTEQMGGTIQVWYGEGKLFIRLCFPDKY